MNNTIFFQLSEIYESIQESYLDTLNALYMNELKSDQITCIMEADETKTSSKKLNEKQIKKILQGHTTNKNGFQVTFEMSDPGEKDPVEHEVFQLIHPKVIALSKDRSNQNLKRDLFKYFGFKHGAESVKLNWYTSGETPKRIILNWMVQSSKDIFKKRPNVRYFHQSETGGIKELYPQNINSLRNGGNYDYGQSAVFLFAIDMTDPKQRSIITNGHYGKHVYEYKPKPSDIFYLDKRDNRTETDHLLWQKFGGCPVFINTKKALPVVEIDPKTIDISGSNNILDNKIVKFKDSKKFKSMKKFVDETSGDMEGIKGNVSRQYQKCISLINSYNKLSGDEEDLEELIDYCELTLKSLKRKKMSTIAEFGKDEKITKSIRTTIGNYNYMINTIIGKAKSKGIDLPVSEKKGSKNNE